MMNKNLGYIHFWGTIIGVYGVFFPMHFVGLAGLPRRYYSNTAFPYFDDLLDTNILITCFAIFTALIQFVFIYNFIRSIFYGKKASQNPWDSTTLEWTTPVEHIHGNWPGEIPHVYRWPYDYSKRKEDDSDYVIPGQDFVPQNVPIQDDEEDLNH